MYRTIADFASDWKYEPAAMLKFITAVSEPSRSQAIVPGGRTLGFLTWHTICAVAEIGRAAGLTVDGPHETLTEKTPAPATVGEMAATYEGSAKSLVSAVRATWTDAQLGDEIDMYNQKFTRGGALAMLVKHQAHHRGQISVLLRQAGLLVPDVYGPTKEDWAKFGMPAQP